MLASFALLQAYIRHARREAAVTTVARPETAMSPSARDRRYGDTSSLEEQAALERWLFVRDSRSAR